MTPKVIFPVTVRVHLIHHDGPMFSSVSGEIPLPVTIDIQASHHPPALQGFLPDGGMNGFAAPSNVARKTNVDGYQLGHKSIFSSVSAEWYGKVKGGATYFLAARSWARAPARMPTMP